MDFATYQQLEGINWSTLKHMAASPLHYHHAVSNPREDTTRLLLGRAVHTAVLEPDEFPIRYAVFEGGARRGKAWDEFEIANSDKDILKAEEYRLCLDIRDAVRSHPRASALFYGSSEVVNQWTDEATGLPCKCRIDHIHRDALIDLKTTGTTDEFQFCGTAARMLYHGQLAFYRRSLGDDRPAVIIAVEMDPPHDVAVFDMTEVALQVGDRTVSECLARVRDCQEAGQWPGRYQESRELSLPAWMENDAVLGGGWDL